MVIILFQKHRVTLCYSSYSVYLAPKAGWSTRVAAQQPEVINDIFG
jgi:hypothetical protein